MYTFLLYTYIIHHHNLVTGSGEPKLKTVGSAREPIQIDGLLCVAGSEEPKLKTTGSAREPYSFYKKGNNNATILCLAGSGEPILKPV